MGDGELVETLRRIMDDEVCSGRECGCQLAIYRDGGLIVNLAAGWIDPVGSAAVGPETLFPVFSVGKGLMATAFHRLAERGTLHYDMRVAELWPEFGCNGKEEVRVWHLLTHRGGLFELPECGSIEEQADWELMCRRVGAMRPAWTPGGKCQYHPLTYAWLLGEVARRADGRPFDQIIREEVIAPLQLEESFFFGTTAEADRRFAPVDASALPEKRSWHTDFMHNPAIRHGFIPAANGVGSAFAIAKHYASLLDGGVDGVRLLAPETVANAAILRRAPDDPVPPEGTWQRFGLGYALYGPAGNLGMIFGHGGAAGAEGFADREHRIALGLTRNKLSLTAPVYPLRDRISAALNLAARHW